MCSSVCAENNFSTETLPTTAAKFRPSSTKLKGHQQVKVRQDSVILIFKREQKKLNGSNYLSLGGGKAARRLIYCPIFLRLLNSPVSVEPGSSELMCCGLACLRLDMVRQSGAKSRRQFSSASSTNSLPWKNYPPSSRNAHVNVIIIINNALRFIAGPRQLIGSSPSAHTLFKSVSY